MDYKDKYIESLEKRIELLEERLRCKEEYTHIWPTPVPYQNPDLRWCTKPQYTYA